MGVVSTFPSMQDMLAPASQRMLQERNALLNQKDQQEIQAADMEMVSRASAYLTTLPEDQRAAAYPGIVSDLQARGFAKRAPATYPGHAAIDALARMGTPSKDLLEQGDVRRSAGDFTNRLLGGGGAFQSPSMRTAPAGTPAAPVAKGTPFVAQNLPAGITPEEDQIVRTVWGEANGQPLAGQQAVAHVILNRAKGSGESTQDVIFKPNQFEPWNTGRRAQLEGLDPASADYQRILNTVVRPVMGGQAQDPTGGATHFLAPGLMAERGTPLPAWASGNQTTIGGHTFYYAPYGRGGGVAARTGGTDVAGPGAPAAAPAASAPPPGIAAPPPVDPRTGLDAEQTQTALDLASRARSRKELAEVQAKVETWREHNQTLARQYQQDQLTYQNTQTTQANQAEHLRLAQQADKRAQEKVDQEARDKAETMVPGQGIEAVHENTVQKLAAKMRRGEKLTDDEQSQYDGAYYALQQQGGQGGTMTDPQNPGRSIPFQTTRRLPPNLPEPKGGALPPVVTNPDAGKQEQMTEGQGQAAAFADRMHLAQPVMDQLEENALTWGETVKRRAGDFVGFTLTSPNYQKLRTAQEAFLAGILRKESGAAVSPSEWERYAKLYFPMPGEDAETIKLKRQFRQAAIEGMQREAGPTYKPAAGAAAPAAAGAPTKVITYGADGKRQ